MSLRNTLLALLTWHTGPEVRSTQSRMEPPPQPNPEAVAARSHRTRAALLDALEESIYTQAPTDWSKVTDLGQMRAVPEVKNTVNLAQQYADGPSPSNRLWAPLRSATPRGWRARSPFVLPAREFETRSRIAPR